jgi:hypothetical protein
LTEYWRTALPDGYGLALAGAGLWVVGGPFDAAWHTVFGFEANVEALMSPAHTVLALGCALMSSGPLRAGLRRPAGPWRDELPMVLSLTFVTCLLTFFMQIAHPLANLWGGGSGAESATVTELGIVSVLFTAAIIVAPVLLLLRQGRLPVGSVTILVTLNSVAMGFLYHQGAYPLPAIVAVAAGGCAADLLRVWLRPSVLRPAAFRAWAFALPTLLQLGYFGALHVSTGIAWSVHLWAGAVVFAGIVGCLLSYLALPPRSQGD